MCVKIKINSKFVVIKFEFMIVKRNHLNLINNSLQKRYFFVVVYFI